MLRRGVLLGLVILASAACSDGTEVATGGSGPRLSATCNDIEFSGMPPDVDEFPPLDDELRAAFVEFTTGPLSVESAEFADFEMSVAERSSDTVLLFGKIPTGGYATVKLVRRDDAWTAQSWGGCDILVSAPGFGSAMTQLDPDREPDPDSTTLHLVIRERECASGQAPTDREVLPVVVESETRIEITTLVEPVGGDVECPGNPWFPVTVELNQPVGTRAIIDTQTPPGVERTWPPSLEAS